jgi:transposase
MVISVEKTCIERWLFPQEELPIPEDVVLSSESNAEVINVNSSEASMDKFKPMYQEQPLLFGMTRENYLAYVSPQIPSDALCRLVKEVVMFLDTSLIESKYSALGQKSYHPKLLLSLLFYGYAIGERSSRQLEERCRRDTHFFFLMDGYSPDYRTISDFRKDNVCELENFFVQILRIFDKLHLSKVGKIYIDGVKIKANASSKRTKDIEGFEKWLKRLEAEVSALLQEAAELDRLEDEKVSTTDSSKQSMKKLCQKENLKSKIKESLKELERETQRRTGVNLTDKDAVHMKSGCSKDIRPSYNCQTSVTEDGVITAAEVTQECNDRNQLKPMVSKSESNTGQAVEQLVSDSGYSSYDNYEYLEKKGIDSYLPDDDFAKHKKGEFNQGENRYHISNFKYDEEKDIYMCPAGHPLVYIKTLKKAYKTKKWNHKIYQGTLCHQCEHKPSCTKNKKKPRELRVELREDLVKSMRAKLLTEEGWREYFKRHHIIESIFGHFKHNLGIRQFLLRGLEKVSGEYRLMCIGWNIRKLHKFGMVGMKLKEMLI